MTPQPPSEADLVAGVLEKLHGFIGSLDAGERSVLAVLLAPGVARAYADEPEVVGFGAGSEQAPGWLPSRLSEELAAQLQAWDYRIEVGDAGPGD